METLRFNIPIILLLAVAAGSGCRNTEVAKAQPLAESSKPAERIGQIRLEGNTVTQDRVILNQLNFKVGDAVDHAKFAKAETSLLRLGIFDGEDPPRVTVAETDPTTGFKTIVVRMKETRTGVVGLKNGTEIRFDR